MAASAAVLESVSVPRAYSLLSKPSAASPRMAMLPPPSARGLPEFRGLKAARKGVRSVSVGGGARRAPRRPCVVCEAQETAIDVPDVTTATWQSSVTESDIPVLVEFWAPWCGPCRMIFPVIGELSKEYAGKLKCLKLNTDSNPDIATKYGIRSIPTIMIFKNGEKKDAIIGAVPKTTLTSSIEKFL